MVAHKHGPEVEAGWVQSDEAAPFAEAKRQLGAYFAGRLTTFDLPLAPDGTAFQMRVWQELRRIPHGQTVSYGELARRIGSPTACRAVGLANGRNPLTIIVPCHRVVGANGKLTGYAGGMARKETLLALEGAAQAHLDFSHKNAIYYTYTVITAKNERPDGASPVVSERLRRQSAARKWPLRRPLSSDKQGYGASSEVLAS